MSPNVRCGPYNLLHPKKHKVLQKFVGQIGLEWTEKHQPQQHRVAMPADGKPSPFGGTDPAPKPVGLYENKHTVRQRQK